MENCETVVKVTHTTRRKLKLIKYTELLNTGENTTYNDLMESFCDEKMKALGLTSEDLKKIK